MEKRLERLTEAINALARVMAEMQVKQAEAKLPLSGSSTDPSPLTRCSKSPLTVVIQFYTAPFYTKRR